MAIRGEWVSFGPHHQYQGYLARPERIHGSLPAVLVFQEIWGVDEHIEDVTRRFASSGYVAFAPDLFVTEKVRPASLARDRVTETQEFVNENGSGVLMNQTTCDAALEKKPEAVRNRIQETMNTLFAELKTGGIQLEKYVPLCLESARYLRQDCRFSKGQKVASVGYCMGGGLSALLACHDPLLAGAVIYYGSAPDKEKLAQIQCNVLGLYGELDARVNAGIPTFVESMKTLGKTFEYQIYPKAQHAFFNDGRPSYDVDASRDSYLRTLQFFKQSLS